MRRLLLIVALVLLPTAALAECAWVLWIEAPGPHYSLSAALPDYQECQKALDSLMANYGGDGVSINLGGVKAIAYCLPDTLDPRGPVTK